MAATSVQGHLVTSMDHVKNPGDFMYTSRRPDPNGPLKEHAGIFFMCPCGCGVWGSISFEPTHEGGASWQWDGNLDKPTLTPSILRLGGCGWHGFLKSGVWEGV